uniref:Uncharacterized protein n=1 Tax=Avena sativa TaxID=4498 RepID=A0ACD5UAG6_AVESA
MRPPGEQGARRDAAKQLKVLMPSCFDRLSISDELAGHLDEGNGGADTAQPTALVVNSFGKVWHVEVGRDGGGAFLGHGWPEFVDANGFGVGWFLVLRHEGRGVLTVKAFDLTCCLKESRGLQPSTATRSKGYGSHKPQFIKVLLPDFMEKMLIPPAFVQRYVSEAQQSSKMAIIASQFGKFRPIEVEEDGHGMFLAGGWPQFLAFHGISEGDVVLFRYEGNMLFKIKVFGLNGCQKNLRGKGAGTQQNSEKQKEAHSYGKHERSSGKEDRRPKGSLSSLNEGPRKKRRFDSFEIGQRPWIKKKISTYMLKKFLSLATTFCDSIGLVGQCTITLKTSMKSTRCWQVGARRLKTYGYLGGEIWRSFCMENKIREGDVCTFHIVETALWHVVITRCSDRTG